MKKPEEGSPRTARANPKASYLRTSIDLPQKGTPDIRAVHAALKKLHITHPSVLAGVTSFLQKLPPTEHTALTASFRGAGGKEVLEIRAYKDQLYFEAPPPKHMQVPASAMTTHIRKLQGGANTKADLRARILAEVPDADTQLREMNEHIGVYNRHVPNDEKVLLTTRDAGRLEVTGFQLRRAGLIVRLPRRGAPQPRVKPTASSPRNRDLAIKNAVILIDVIQQVVDYKHRPGDNNPPPGLWADDRDYLETLRELLAELRKLNAALQAPASKAGTAKASINFTRSAQKFFDTSAVSLGKRTGPAMMAAITGAILYFSGVNIETVGKFYNIFK